MFETYRLSTSVEKENVARKSVSFNSKEEYSVKEWSLILASLFVQYQNNNIHSAPPNPPPKSIFFYNRGEPYFEFNNFFEEAPIKINNWPWHSTEHYFQAMKFSNTDLQELVWNCKTPHGAFELARMHSYEIRKDWNWI